MKKISLKQKLILAITPVLVIFCVFLFAQTTEGQILDAFDAKWGLIYGLVYFGMSFAITKIPFLQKLGDAKFLTAILAFAITIFAVFWHNLPLPTVGVGIAAFTKLYDLIWGGNDSMKGETIWVKKQPEVIKAIDKEITEQKKLKMAA